MRRDIGLGSRESGIGNRESGIGNWERQFDLMVRYGAGCFNKARRVGKSGLNRP
ncbi:hypothetical protein [Moorena sp. SIO4G3]|uniref:hypothetical protein n=1 Tax=Moorena sp. SIO4G3 TaxID=2607821 RepID=UPI00142C1E1F|nr:hypothetical protein [Moorena sp. SIO4G3]NEO77167.1 hypothetical protein [Moorena sp. SIO4G3]